MTDPPRPRLVARIQALLAHRRLPWILAIVSMVLVVPSAFTGLQLDDYFHRDILLGREPRPASDASLTGMFSFFDGNPEAARQKMDTGILPWWCFEEIRMKFFRPLSEITHLLDYWCWPQSPVLMHLHTIFWFGLMVATAALLYRQVMSPAWIAGLAACLYAFDEAHGFTAGWIAHRNATLATVFGILTLILHIRWQQKSWRPGSYLAPCCLALGLLASEGAVATGAYLFAYQLFLAPGNFFRKMKCLFPYAIIGIVWFCAYRNLGFGTWGSGAYLDPASEPLLYLRAFLERAPLLLTGQWFNVGTLLLGNSPDPFYSIVFVGFVACLSVLGILLIPVIRQSAEARFWALGMGLSLIPICATFVSNRLLNFVGLGAMGLCAQFMASWFEKAEWLPASPMWRRLARVAVVVLVALHLVYAPLWLPISSCNLAVWTRALQQRPMRQALEKFDISGGTAIFVDAPSPLGLYYEAAYLGEKHGLPVPDRMQFLSNAPRSTKELTRIDAYTIEVAVQDGLFLDTEFSELIRGSSHPMKEGQQVILSHMDARILDVNADRQVCRVRFTFPVPLEDPSLYLVAWVRPNFIQLDPPGIGETIHLAPRGFRFARFLGGKN